MRGVCGEARKVKVFELLEVLGAEQVADVNWPLAETWKCKHKM